MVSFQKSSHVLALQRRSGRVDKPRSSNARERSFKKVPCSFTIFVALIASAKATFSEHEMLKLQLMFKGMKYSSIGPMIETRNDIRLERDEIVAIQTAEELKIMGEYESISKFRDGQKEWVDVKTSSCSTIGTTKSKILGEVLIASFTLGGSKGGVETTLNMYHYVDSKCSNGKVVFGLPQKHHLWVITPMEDGSIVWFSSKTGDMFKYERTPTIADSEEQKKSVQERLDQPPTMPEIVATGSENGRSDGETSEGEGNAPVPAETYTPPPARKNPMGDEKTNESDAGERNCWIHVGCEKGSWFIDNTTTTTQKVERHRAADFNKDTHRDKLRNKVRAAVTDYPEQMCYKCRAFRKPESDYYYVIDRETMPKGTVSADVAYKA